MIPLSDKTRQVIDAVIVPSKREWVSYRLLEQASENIPGNENSTPEEMERIRFSILRLISETPEHENHIFDLAYTDWRDLFMAAEHGEGPKAHFRWADQVIKEAAGRQDSDSKS